MSSADKIKKDGVIMRVIVQLVRKCAFVISDLQCYACYV